MWDNTFGDQVGWALRRVDDLKARAASATSSAGELLPEALAELSAAFDELLAAEKQLRTRNQELTRSRVAADAERHRYQDLFEAAPEAYLVTDPEGVIREANRAAAGLLNVPARHLAGKPLVHFVAEPDRLAFDAELHQFEGGRLPGDSVLRLWPRGDKESERTVAVGVAVQRDPETGRVGLCWQMRDITARVRAEGELRALNGFLEHRVRERTSQLEAALRDRQKLLEAERVHRGRAEEAERRLRTEARQKDDFLALLAHELRGPLGPMRQAVHILASPPAEESEVEWARGVVQRQVGHMARLVDDLLDAARIARGKLTLMRERIDLAALVWAVVRDRRAGLEERGLGVEVELPVASAWVDGDAIRLTQVVGNLLHNAAKFTDRGGRVAVRVEADSRTARVSVTDTGVGIDPEALSHVFTMFTQGERDLARSPGGLGLGLAVVRGVVELHGGRVEARSEGSGRGSTFAFELPTADAPGAAEASPVEPEERSLRALLVEDNRDAADSLARLLRRWGHEVRVAYDGTSGLEVAREFRPEVVVCDIGLPGLSGYDVARRLRADPATASCRLVAASGYGREADRLESVAAGFEEHLVKPVDLDLLRRLLGRAGVGRGQTPPPVTTSPR